MTRYLLPLILALATCWASNSIFDDVPPRLFQETSDKSPDFRLPTNIKPIHYDITLRPVFNTSDDTNFTFTGTSIIILEVINLTESNNNKIVFHAKDLNIKNSSVFMVDGVGPLFNETEIQVKEIIRDEIPERDFVTLVLEDNIIEGTQVILTLNFDGKLNQKDLRGFYKSSYKTEKDEEV